MVNNKLNINIPSDWTVKYLDDFGNIVSGGTPSTSVSTYWNGLISWCTPTDITGTEGNTISQTEKTITEEGLKNSAAVILPAGSLLLCTRATIGDSKINSIPMATNQGFKNVIPFKETCIKYLYYLLQTKKREMLEKATASTFAEISKSALCEIALQAPKKSEQEKIAEVLSDVDELIMDLQKLINKKKDIRQGTMQMLVTGRKRIAGFHDVYKKYTLGEIGGVVKNSIMPKNEPNVLFEEYSMPAFDDGKLPKQIAGKQMLSSRISITPNTLLFNKLNVRQRRVWLVKECASNAVCSSEFLPYKSNRVDLAYLMQFLLTDKVAQDFEGLSSGTSNSQQRITPADFLKYEVSLPSMPEQKIIAEILGDMDSEIYRLEDKIHKYGRIKQGMMEELLTGKVRLI